MAIIMGKSKAASKKVGADDMKKAYTWGACVMVLLLVGVSISAIFKQGPGTENRLDSLKNKSYDLASMPFVDDLAEWDLLGGPYSDIKRDPVDASLYTLQEREERMALDEAAGLQVTPPADEEYAAAAPEQEAKAAARRAAVTRPKTEIRHLSGTGGAFAGVSGFSGGGSGGWSSSGSGYSANRGGSGGGKAGTTAYDPFARSGRAMSGLMAVNKAAKQADGTLTGNAKSLDPFEGGSTLGEGEVEGDYGFEIPLGGNDDTPLPTPLDEIAPPTKEEFEAEQCTCEGKLKGSSECKTNQFISIAGPIIIMGSMAALGGFAAPAAAAGGAAAGAGAAAGGAAFSGAGALSGLGASGGLTNVIMGPINQAMNNRLKCD